MKERKKQRKSFGQLDCTRIGSIAGRQVIKLSSNVPKTHLRAGSGCHICHQVQVINASLHLKTLFVLFLRMY